MRVIASAFLVVALSVIALSCGVGKRSYVRENEKFWHSLPEYPGASLVRVTSASYRETEHDPISGYTTNPVYQIPTTVQPLDVIDFFVDELPDGWKYRIDEIPTSDGVNEFAPILIARFCNRARGFDVDTSGMPATLNRFEISLDHERYKSEEEQAAACNG